MISARKYRNQPVEVHGLKFDSRKEFRRWSDLCLLERTGEIQELDRQVRFRLEVNGQKIADYVADFTYRKDGKLVVEDVKSEATAKLPVFRIKAKLMKACHDIDVVLS